MKTLIFSTLAPAILLVIFTSATPVYATDNSVPATKGMEVVSLTPSAANEIDLDELVRRLKRTRAISVLAKLDYHFRLNKLINEIYVNHRQANPYENPALRNRFNGIVNEVLSQLWQGDHSLYQDIAKSRRAIWRAVVVEGTTE